MELIKCKKNQAFNLEQWKSSEAMKYSPKDFIYTHREKTPEIWEVEIKGETHLIEQDFTQWDWSRDVKIKCLIIDQLGKNGAYVNIYTTDGERTIGHEISDDVDYIEFKAEVFYP